MAKAKRYEELADQVIKLIGGKDNVIFFTHCVTRLRFKVKDRSIVEMEEIKSVDGVMGCQWAGEQFQVIIGQAVNDAYNLICQKYGLGKQDAIAENLEGTPQKKLSMGFLIDMISGCLTPVVPVMMAGGFIKIVVILGELLGLLEAGNSTHTVLSFVGDAAFYFLPVFVGANAAKKFGANQGLGMMLGAMFIHPSFIAALAEGPLNILGIPIYNTSYSSSIFPVLISTAVMAPIERFIAKHSPDAIRSIVEPFLTMLIMIPLALCLLGPIGAFLGQYIAAAIMWLYDTVGFVGVAIFTGLYPVLVITSMHGGLMPYLMSSLTTQGFEPIVFTGMIISNVLQGIACLAVAVKSKDKTIKSVAGGCVVAAMIGGVCEPALYGVNLKYRKPLYGVMIGGVVGGAVAGLGHACAYSLTGSAGILGGLPIYIPGGAANLMWMVAGIIAGCITTFAITLILYKEN